MFVDGDAINRALAPIKDYPDLCRRFRAAFAYPFVCETFNYSLPALADYTQRLLGGDSRGRYTEYLFLLMDILHELRQAGVRDVLDLISRVESRQKLESFAEGEKIHAHRIVQLQRYLVYWFIPGEKYLSGLVGSEASSREAVKRLGETGVKTNLQILQKGITPAGRRALAAASGLPEETISGLVNRADFSRMPWASKATISNIIGAGYPSLSALASADPEKLFGDFFRYGKSIGKNLKLGNEIENSYRIAQIVPPIVQPGS